MRKASILACILFFLLGSGQVVRAELEVSLEPLQTFNKEGHSVPLLYKIKNNSPVTADVPQYFVPYFDLDLKVQDAQGKSKGRSSPVYSLTYLKPTNIQQLGPGEVYSQKINDLRELYQTDQVGWYTVQPVYYPERDPSKAVSGKMLQVPVGNVAGDRGFLIFSDTAYMEKTFSFSAIYPDLSYILRDHSNNYFIFGLSSSWLQAGIGYSDGTYGGLKWQVWPEGGWYPAFAAHFFQLNAGREVITLDRDVLGYWMEQRASSYVFSKRLPGRAHIHLGVKRHDLYSKVESQSAVEAVYPLTMVALDQSYPWGMLVYERNFDTQQDFLSEAFMYRGLPSWEPQLGVGLAHYYSATFRDMTVIFLALYFNMDNFLLGINF
jgi:hypothetical protein